MFSSAREERGTILISGATFFGILNVVTCSTWVTMGDIGPGTAAISPNLVIPLTTVFELDFFFYFHFNVDFLLAA